MGCCVPVKKDPMKLQTFIQNNLDAIIDKWEEAFARTLLLRQKTCRTSLFATKAVKS